MKSSVMRWIGLLIGINVETVVFVVSAYYGGRYLDEHFPKQGSWMTVMMAVAVLLILLSLWRVGLEVWRESQRSEKSESDS